MPPGPEDRARLDAIVPPGIARERHDPSRMAHLDSGIGRALRPAYCVAAAEPSAGSKISCFFLSM